MLVMAEDRQEQQSLLTPEQVAKRLNITEQKLGKLLRAKKIRGVKVEREWRIHPLELEDYINRNTQQLS